MIDKMTKKESKTLALMKDASQKQDEKRKARTRLRNKAYLPARIKHYEELIKASVEKLDEAKAAEASAAEASKAANAGGAGSDVAKAANEAYAKAKAAVEAAEAECTKNKVKHTVSINRMIDFSKADHEGDYEKARASDIAARKKARTAYRDMHRSGVNITSSEVRFLALKLGFPTDHNLAVK